MKRPAAAPVAAPRPLVRQRTHSKGGGPHPDLGRSRAEFVAAETAAIARARLQPSAEGAYVSKVCIAVNWESHWKACYNCKLDNEPQYEKELAARLGVGRKKICTKRRNFIASFKYAYPSTEPFFQKLTNDWIHAFEAQCRGDGCSPWSRFRSKAKLTVKDGEVSVDFEVFSARADETKEAALRVHDVAHALVHGPVCGKTQGRCGRHTDSGHAGSPCCHMCCQTDGAHHTDACNIRHAAVESDAQQRILSVAQRMGVAETPVSAIQMVTLVEAPHPIKTLSDQDLSLLAASVGSSSARVIGEIEAVTCTGRFICKCMGGERAGCYVCHTKPMVRWCWHDHASSTAHGLKVASSQEQEPASQSGRTVLDPCPTDHNDEDDESIAFRENVDALLIWLKDNEGEYPQKQDGTSRREKIEHALAVWVFHQRAYYKQNRLTLSQINQLKQLPGWSWQPWECQWQKSLDALTKWVAKKTQYPNKKSADAHEKWLGQWVADQKKSYSGQRLPLLTATRLRRLLEVPGWTFPVPPDVPWVTYFALVKKWFRDDSDFAKPDAHIAAKQWLPIGQWYAAQTTPGEGNATGTAKQRAQFIAWRQSCM